MKSHRFLSAAALCALVAAPLAADGQDVPSVGSSQNERACIAIVLPSVNGVEGSASNIAAALRELFTSYLTGPSIQVVAVDARLAAQATEEARQKSCDRILFATLTEKHAGGGGFTKALGHAANVSSWMVPGGGSAASAAARVATTAGLQTVASLAASTKAKDECRLEYRLETTNGQTPLRPTTEQAKARVDGEDLLTPLVEKAAGVIAAAATTGKK